MEHESIQMKDRNRDDTPENEEDETVQVKSDNLETSTASGFNTEIR